MLKNNTNLIIGDIDSGKTKGIIFKELGDFITNNENLLILDPKEEYYSRFKKDLVDKGYNIYVINLVNPNNSNGWNPLEYPYYLYKKGEIDKSLDLVNSISNTICISNNKNADPFWDLTAANYLSGLIITLFEKGKETEISLTNLGILIGKSEEKKGDSSLVKEYFDKLDPLNPAYILASSTVYAPPSTKSSILSVLRQKINLFLMRPTMLKMLSTNELKISKIEDKTAIFVISKDNLNSITNILIKELINSINYQKLSFTFVLDNFNTLPKFDIMNELIENAAYNKIKSIFAIHNIEEIVDKYETNVFAKISNIIDMKEYKNVDIDKTENQTNYPKLKDDKVELLDINEIFN